MTAREVIHSLGMDYQHEVLEISEGTDGYIITATSRQLADALLLNMPELAQKGASIRLLPDVSIGQAQLAYCTVAAAPVRSQPKHSAEIWTFAWQGSRLQLLEANNKWLRVKLPDGYIGWLHQEQVFRPHPCSQDFWRPANKSTPRVPYLTVNPVLSGSAPQLILRGSEVLLQSKANTQPVIQLPNGARYLCSDGLFEPLPGVESWDSKRFISEALLYGGIPYVWGGNTPLGLDCSGLVQLSARMCGKLLPRDASQQAKLGHRIERSDWKSDWVPGDLILFGEKLGQVTHVAIYLGNGSYIHASGYVRINSLKATESSFEPYRYETLQFATRIF